MNAESVFHTLFRASTESSVDDVLAAHAEFADPSNWRPYGQNESNFGVVENQQASPIPALIEKLINSIDAILMRKCIEAGVDPKQPDAPRSIDEAIQRFFSEARSWDLTTFRKHQADSIQIIASGPRMETSLVIYDDGEGQHPVDFEKTFLSLLRGNKTEIHFVQGKYNMGGSGAVAFCGKKRYQLIGSRRFDRSGPFGFTLVRRHPLSVHERTTKRATWYEYFTHNAEIPSFLPASGMDLGLHGREFVTGTVIKLYSYDLPAGSRSVISRDLNQSINEYLFSPALPILTVDTAERYPKDRNLQRDLFGLKRRLEEEGNKYIAEFFSEDYSDAMIGRLRITCYVFAAKLEDRSAKETRETTQREFFKNNMSVLFSVHGQVHGHYTSEFITRSLKFPLLKDYLLIHVDCTDLDMEFRNELFMASRDRLKEAEEARSLRQRLTEILSKGRLAQLYADRKASISVEGSDSDELLRTFSRNLPFSRELAQLISQTFRLDEVRPGERKERVRQKPADGVGERPQFSPNRFPSFFRIERKPEAELGVPMVQVPIGSERTIRFATDVEDHYFDRVNEPGELQLMLLGVSSNRVDGGTAPGLPSRVDDLLDVVKSSPDAGTIRVTVKATDSVKTGAAIKLRARLTGPGSEFDQIFFVRIVDPELRKIKVTREGPDPDQNLGLPKLVLVYRESGKSEVTWDVLDKQGIVMDYDTIMHPLVEGDVLGAIYINMDSHVLLSFKARILTEEGLRVADRRYFSAVYFHTLFLYMISKSKKYSVTQTTGDGSDKVVDLADYLKDLFQSHYSEFLLKFEVQDLIANLEA